MLLLLHICKGQSLYFARLLICIMLTLWKQSAKVHMSGVDYSSSLYYFLRYPKQKKCISSCTDYRSGCRFVPFNHAFLPFQLVSENTWFANLTTANCKIRSFLPCHIFPKMFQRCDKTTRDLLCNTLDEFPVNWTVFSMTWTIKMDRYIKKKIHIGTATDAVSNQLSPRRKYSWKYFAPVHSSNV